MTSVTAVEAGIGQGELSGVAPEVPCAGVRPREARWNVILSPW